MGKRGISIGKHIKKKGGAKMKLFKMQQRIVGIIRTTKENEKLIKKILDLIRETDEKTLKQWIFEQ